MFDIFNNDAKIDQARRIDTTAIVALLIDKGIITLDEYKAAKEKAKTVIEEADEEELKKVREEWLSKLGNKTEE